MKTSNKLLLSAVLFFFCLLAVYNVALTAEYRKDNFRDIYKDFNILENKGFSKITVNGASRMNVEITQGDYHVRVHKKAAVFVQVTQQGDELILDVNYPEEKIEIPSGLHVVIYCPDLTLLKADAVYGSNGTRHIDQAVLERYGMRYNVTVKNMQLDNLFIQQDNASVVSLSNNSINKLDAIIGVSNGSGPKLYVGNGNDIKEGALDVQNRSELVLENINPDIKLKHSNTAKVVLSGASLSILKQ